MLTLMQPPDVYGGDAAKTSRLIANLLQLMETKNSQLFAHSRQVANYAVSIAAKMRLPREELDYIRTAALLHDLGKTTVPNAVLAKVPYLSTREQSLMKKHCDAGAYMLENLPDCQEIIPLIRYHHERWDGKGYPKRLKGVNIPLGARIIAVANYYDRHINPCSEHWRKTPEEAARELLNLAGTAFDPEVVKAFLDALGTNGKEPEKTET